MEDVYVKVSPRLAAARSPLLAAVVALLGGPPAAAQTAPVVVITGSVVEREVVAAPFAVSVVDRDELRSAGPLVNLSEAAPRVPGLVVANRWNYAQDLQISSRGFGARAGFGVRGVRLYSDGIPASGPDGQGQVSHFDLASAERVEVLRGPFSVLYGNSSGGVISLISRSPRESRWEVAADRGSFGVKQLRLQGETRLGGGFDLRAGGATFEVDGFRPHAAAERKLATLRLGFEGGSDSVVAAASYLDQPAQDPLGLTRDRFDVDPRQATAEALQYDTRKTTRQAQAGLRWKHRFDLGALRDTELAAYGGQRHVQQFLAIAAATQANARHGGGVVDFDRDYGGGEARARFAWDDLDIVLGLATDRQTDQRRGYLNYTGAAAAPQYGQVGALRRNETNEARSTDLFAQAEWAFTRQWTFSAGLRGGRVELSSVDAYLGNGDDSGRREFSYRNPVLGLRWAPSSAWSLYGSVARGFESPTLGELAYRRDGTGGFNTDLRAQRSTQTELGAKWRQGDLQADFTLFEARVSDEIGVATNAGGRSAFQNVGGTLRRGAELGGRWAMMPSLRASWSATWLDASYRDSFLVCAGIPCNAPTLTVPAGNRIAGTQRESIWTELAWRSDAAGEFAADLRSAGNTVVNDRNTEAAPGYALMGLRWSLRWPRTPFGQAELLLRVDNVADRRYAGSVIVNDANGRFYEPGAPRSALISLRLTGP